MDDLYAQAIEQGRRDRERIQRVVRAAMKQLRELDERTEDE